MQKKQWEPNVILIDADYVDSVVFDLTVNFERMLDRSIERADLPRWLDCLALDGGIRPGDHKIQVMLLHTSELKALKNFTPSDFSGELDAKAFRDNLGEFTLHSFAAEGVVTHEQFFLQSLKTLLEAEEVKRLLVVGNMEQSAPEILSTLQETGEKEIILFSMTPQQGDGFKSEILGYSLMQALGISADELR